MRHKLDIHPVPEEVLYINELSLAENVPYETKDTMEKAVTGKCVRDSGILPDDNVRIYVPMDLNADIIMWQLYSLFGSHGYPMLIQELQQTNLPRMKLICSGLSSPFCWLML